MDNGKYRFTCTLTFGDIYGQIIVWLVILIISLAASLALMGARQPIFCPGYGRFDFSAVAPLFAVCFCDHVAEPY